MMKECNNPYYQIGQIHYITIVKQRLLTKDNIKTRTDQVRAQELVNNLVLLLLLYYVQYFGQLYYITY